MHHFKEILDFFLMLCQNIFLLISQEKDINRQWMTRRISQRNKSEETRGASVAISEIIPCPT